MNAKLPRIEPRYVSEGQLKQLISLVCANFNIIIESRHKDQIKIAMVFHHDSYAIFQEAIEAICSNPSQ